MGERRLTATAGSAASLNARTIRARLREARPAAAVPAVWSGFPAIKENP
jgi:hypothetical protein